MRRSAGSAENVAALHVSGLRAGEAGHGGKEIDELHGAWTLLPAREAFGSLMMSGTCSTSR
jgi:hypothetical protein